jgi:hypothetical protein
MPPATATEKPRPADMIPADEVEAIIAQRVAAEVDRVKSEVGSQVGAEIARQLAELKGGAAPSPGNGDQSWMEALALAISNVTDQEIGRRRVPPEEIAKRTRAKGRLDALMEETVKLGVQPSYYLRKQVYFGEQMISPIWIDRATKEAKPTEIGWWGIPNQFMDPVNEEAKAIFALFLEWIGDSKRTTNGMRVTPGGLVVRSGGMPVEGGRDAAPRVGRDQPTVKSRGGQQRSIETRILGTLMEPAKQMVG